MVELRKRPAPKETATPAPPAKKAASKAKAVAPKAKAETAKPKATSTAEASTTKKTSEASKGSKDSKLPLSTTSIGTKITLTNTLDTSIKLNTDTPTSITKLLAESKTGIVIFSYPKASTPGCTTQACLFRDSYTPLTEAGLSVYGLSADSPKSNTTFITKQNLPYPLLCDPEGAVSGPLGLKKPNPAKGTVRGVVLLSKVDDGATTEEEANVDVYFLGGPQKTLDVVLEWVEKEKKKSAKL